MSYASAEFWDHVYRTYGDHDLALLPLQQLLSRDRWTASFLKPLERNATKRILDLGCGMGYEAGSLLREGYEVTGLDYSLEAVKIARSHSGSLGTFLVADMAQPLPLPNAHFDAVISNVAAHMFGDEITRSIFFEVRRILRPSGLFMFHLNSLEDRELRAQNKRVRRELEENYILEEDGQTMHFFSQDYLVDLLSEWTEAQLEPVEILSHKTQGYIHRIMEGYPRYEEDEERDALLDAGYCPDKRTWRGIARR